MRHLSEPDYGLSTRASNPLEWMHESICEQVDPELFFADDGSPAAANARSVCQSCPVLATCREYALRQPNLHGIWGNTSRSERLIIRVLYLDLDELTAVEVAEAADDTDLMAVEEVVA